MTAQGGYSVPTQPQNPIPSNDVSFQTSQNPISSNNATHQTPKKLFVGGVARETTRETFNDFFESYGKMSDCILMFRDGRSRCFGFVTYEEVSSMNRVLVSKIELDGKVLDVKIAVPAEKVAPDSYGRYSRSEHDSNRTCKVFVGGLPKEVELEELKNHFAQFGEMVDAFIVKNKETKESRGFGFVIYNREEEVDKVLAYTNHVLGGKEVNCRKAKAKERERDDGYDPYYSQYGRPSPYSRYDYDPYERGHNYYASRRRSYYHDQRPPSSRYYPYEDRRGYGERERDYGSRYCRSYGRDDGYHSYRR